METVCGDPSSKKGALVSSDYNVLTDVHKGHGCRIENCPHEWHIVKAIDTRDKFYWIIKCRMCGDEHLVPNSTWQRMRRDITLGKRP